ncbi:MAG TPA: hypothetical protein VKH41_07045 [Myxococcota bacterium]|nr:hypothetical protein [Myxococcota bacterium]
MSTHEQTPRTPGVPDTGQRLQPSVAQLEAKVAHELSNLLNVVAACGDRLAGSPEVTAAARLDLLA